MGVTEDHHHSSPHDVQAPTADEVLAQLSRTLGSADFPATARRKALLHYLVAETLEGRGHLLKGVSVAMSVYGRDEHFDQQSDPIVRIEARQLRSDLDAYYGKAGRDDALRISIPKGGYVVHFDWQRFLSGDDASAKVPPATQRPIAAEKLAPKSPRLFAWAVAVVLGAALIATGVWYVRSPGSGQGLTEAAAQTVPVMVLPFTALDASSDSTYLAEGITQELITDLMRFSGLKLYAMNASFRQKSDADPSTLATDLGVNYVVRGSVASQGETLRVMADVVNAKNGQEVWSQSYDRPMAAEKMLVLSATLAEEISAAMGQSYGAVKTDLLAQAGQSNPELASYLCVLRAYSYRRSFDPALLGPVKTCLQDAVARDPTYPEAWALLGWTHLDEVRFNLIPAAAASQTMAVALQETSRAVELAPKSATALQASASVAYYSGRIDESEQLMQTALSLNPNDPDTLVQFGWRLAARGKWDQGIPLVEKAIARTINPPGWYYHAIAVHQYLQKDYTGAIAAAERSAVNGSAVGLSIVAAAEAALGNDEAASAALVSMGEADPDMKVDPAAVYRTHQIIEPTVEALMAGLRKAGWKAP